MSKATVKELQKFGKELSKDVWNHIPIDKKDWDEYRKDLTYFLHMRRYFKKGYKCK